VDWVNQLTFQIMLVISIAVIAVGIVAEVRRRKR